MNKIKIKNKKRVTIIAILLASIILSVFLYLNRAYAATASASINDYDFGYMYWMSNDSLMYGYSKTNYTNYWQDPKPLYPKDKYGHYSEDQGSMSNSGWTATNVDWTINVKPWITSTILENGNNPSPSKLEHSDVGWMDTVLNHYRKSALVYYSKKSNINITISTPSSSYTMQSTDNTINIPIKIDGLAHIHPSHILKPRVDLLDYSLNGVKTTKGDLYELSNAVTVEQYTNNVSDINNASFEGYHVYNYSFDRSQLKPGSNTLTINGEFDVPVRCGSDFNTTDTGTVKTSLTVTINVEDASAPPPPQQSTKPNLKPTDIQVFDSSNNLQQTLFTGKMYNAVVTISNTNTVDAAETQTALYLDDNYYTYVTTPGIKGGDTAKVQITFTAQKTGVTKLTAEANYQQIIDESDFTDNKYSITTEDYQGQGPTATIYAPAKVAWGDDVTVTAYGSSNEPTVTTLQNLINFSELLGVNGDTTVSGSVFKYDENSTSKTSTAQGVVWFSMLGTYHANTTVIDSNNQTAMASTTIEVVPPVPRATIIQSGTLKQNRRIILDGSKSFSGSKRVNIDWTKAQWTLQAVSGGTNSDIKVVEPLQQSKILNVLVKEAGKYQATLSVTNDWGLTDITTYSFDVVPDSPPIPNFALISNLLRDPGDNASSGYAQATQNITDDETTQNGSYSSDGDIIQKRAWLIAFDSNNDGDFRDETYYMYDPTYDGPNNLHTDDRHYRPIGDYDTAKNIDLSKYNCGNIKILEFKSTHVGKYDTELLIKEEFGQATIDQFVTDSDRKQASTFN